MKKKEIRYEHKPSTKEYLLALARFPCYLKLLEAREEPYLPLLNWLIAKGKELLDDNLKLPTIKELSSEIHIPTDKIPKYLKTIYDNIYEMNSIEPNKFKMNGQKLCNCSFEYIGCYASFNLGLDFIPRIGEVFQFDFVKPQCGGYNFHVKKIYHEIINDEQTIFISLGSERNDYLELLKEKAYLKHWISLSDYCGKTENIKEELVKMFDNL